MYPIVTTGDRNVLKAFFTNTTSLGLIACAGGIRNSFLAGAHIYCRQQRGRLREPVACIGVSSGYATRAYYQGSGKATDVRVFSHDMSTTRGQLFKLTRRHPFDVDYVDAVFRYGSTGRPIHASQVINHPTKLYGLLADPQTGQGFVCRAESSEEVWDLATASSAVTGFSRPTFFRGQLVTDGYASDSHLPVDELIRLHPEVTDILIFAAQHYEDNPRPASALEMFLYRTGFATASRPMQRLIRTRHMRFMAEAQRVVHARHVGGRRVCIVWLPRPYHPIYVSERESRDLIRMGYYTMRTLLEAVGVP